MTTDLELLARVRRGEERALTELYRRHGAKIYALGLRMLRSREEADELLQDTFVKLYRNAARYRGFRPGPGRPATVQTFLYGIARNEALMRLRARRARPEKAVAWDVHDPASPLAGPEGADPVDAIALERALEQLTADDRELLRQAFFWGYSHSELADRTGLALGTVKSRLRRALIRLRHLLEDCDDA